MRKFAWILGLAAIAMASFADGASADSGEHAVKARQSYMQLLAFNIGQLGAMAKGEMAYDASTAQAAADNMLAISKLNAGAMWPMGSGNDNTALKTRAKPTIWSTYPKVAEKGAALTAALENYVKVAGKDLASLQGGIGEVGKACGSCHETFRAEK